LFVIKSRAEFLSRDAVTPALKHPCGRKPQAVHAVVPELQEQLADIEAVIRK
jgi:hypothetical protein